ncbi:MAG: hypothetical protein HY063_00760 [Bacteroidetes bacterium]|nr:hypothetical protein [Bacteroidota bacterium]
MIKRLIYLFIFSLLFSGCFIFRPKNKCGDCPEWNKKSSRAQQFLIRHSNNT